MPTRECVSEYQILRRQKLLWRRRLLDGQFCGINLLQPLCSVVRVDAVPAPTSLCRPRWDGGRGAWWERRGGGQQRPRAAVEHCECDFGELTSNWVWR
jgi:hypothetical protein